MEVLLPEVTAALTLAFVVASVRKWSAIATPVVSCRKHSTSQTVVVEDFVKGLSGSCVLPILFHLLANLINDGIFQRLHQFEGLLRVTC